MSSRTRYARGGLTPAQARSFRGVAAAVATAFEGIKAAVRPVMRTMTEQMWLVSLAFKMHTAGQGLPERARPLARLDAKVRYRIAVDTVAERRDWRAWLAGQREAARRDCRLIVAHLEISSGVVPYTPDNIVRGDQ